MQIRNGLLASIVVLLFVTLTPIGPLFGQEEERTWPDIKDPGMDLGDFPNSAFTIPRGTCQVEFVPISFSGRGRFDSAQYQTPFLLRYGVTDDVELRLFSNGLTSVFDDPQVTGFSPPALNSKIHLWDEQREWLLPASSMELTLFTDWGTPAFSSGYQPAISFNFDFALTEKLNLEWTVGCGGVVGSRMVAGPGPAFTPTPTPEDVSQFVVQWALARSMTDDLELFVTGQTLETVPGHAGGTTLAFGGSWKASDRLIYYSLLGWGASPDAPQFLAQVGMGLALGRARGDSKSE